MNNAHGFCASRELKRASLREVKTKCLRRRKEGQDGAGDLVSCKMELKCFIVPRDA